MTKEDKKDILEGLKKIGFAAVAATIIVLVGLTESIAIIPTTAVVAGVGGYFASNKNKSATAAWALLGLLAGIGFYLAI